MPLAIVTGGQGDLAQAIASELRAGGWTVEAPGRSDLDVCSAESVKCYFGGYPEVALLVNNAGICRDALVARSVERDWEVVVSTNLTGAWRCSQQAIRAMLKSRTPGHIVQIGSFAALRGSLGQSSYAAAKAGLIGLTQSLAKEAGGRGIRSNCILPGFLETQMTRDLDSDVLERVRDEHCLKKFTTTEDTARFLLTLNDLHGISGQVFNLDSRIARW